MSAILGRKLGMTSIFTDDGNFVPCTVIEAGPCPVVQVKTKDNDGYDAVQIGYESIAERKVNRPRAGHFAKNDVEPTRHLKEFRQLVAKVKNGDIITVEAFATGDKVKVSATSKGKGFQGVVRRHHFGGVGMATHGQSDRPRAPGSIGSSSYPSRVFKGMRMAGRMGGTRITIRNLTVLRVMPEQNLLLVKGSIPGAMNSVVEIVKL
ncbi:MAG: 50S ribosomal protein L3 [Ignavibacteria bacterium]|nr:50S ribosomal protein L3 [Ignavibacteria bacterium]MBP6509032.1 50S ribosomal protein L3 [Candidatus Kapabacteria bacterium]MBK6419403.1 50S ribosomal protein L3 [Ignavibacteria bacterium]MBK6759966.1 50S ribosomal protein L3 [Ignavibacteria bacterium]MBK7032836.1 50S ribosomal protein L3 [Ignavibacteria bacterium]